MKALCQEGAWLFQEAEKKVRLDLENKEGILGNKVEMGHRAMEWT